MCAEYRIPHSQFLAWSQPDRDKALWWHVRVKSTCAGCGTRPEEWDEERGGDRHAYAAVTSRCPGCEQVQAKQASLTKDTGRGVYVALRPVDRKGARPRGQ